MDMSIADALREVERFKNLFRALEKVEGVLAAVRDAEQTAREKQAVAAVAADAAAAAEAAKASGEAAVRDIQGRLVALNAELSATARSVDAAKRDLDETQRTLASQKQATNDLAEQILGRTATLTDLDHAAAAAEARVAQATDALAKLVAKLGG